MDPQPMGKVRYLSRLAQRVAARSTVRWSSLWIFLGICLLAAVVGDVAAGLPPAQGAAAVAGMPRPAQGPAFLLQKITFEPPEPEPTVRADPVPGPPTLVSVQNTGAGVTHTELVDRATHQTTATQRPAVNLLVDNRQTATVELGLSVVFTISALVAGIRGGRLVAIHSGRCNVTATLAVQDTKVISRQVAFEMPGIIPLGQGFALLPDLDHPAGAGDEISQASVA